MIRFDRYSIETQEKRCPLFLGVHKGTNTVPGTPPSFLRFKKRPVPPGSGGATSPPIDVPDFEIRGRFLGSIEDDDDDEDVDSSQAVASRVMPLLTSGGVKVGADVLGNAEPPLSASLCS